jgi:hypothetical protein
MDKSRADYRLDEPANDALDGAMLDFCDRMCLKAQRLAEGPRITANDIEDAYQQLRPLDSDVQDAQAIVAQVLRENRWMERAACVMTFTLFACGIGLLCFAVFGSPDVPVLVAAIAGGSVLEVLLWMPIRLLINSRRHNILIRVFGLTIDRVHDPEKLTALLTAMLQSMSLDGTRSSSR